MSTRSASGRCRAPLAWGAFIAIGLTLGTIIGCAARSNPARVTHQVAIRGMHFEPTVVHVAVGDTVRWTNLDLVPHTATSQQAPFDSGDLPPDSLWAVVVAHGGVLEYKCRYHPAMKGSIVAGS